MTFSHLGSIMSFISTRIIIGSLLLGISVRLEAKGRRISLNIGKTVEQTVDELGWGTPFDTRGCSLSQSVKSEVSTYKPVATAIHALVKNGTFKGKFYNDLATFVDTFGSRLSGSPLYEKAITHMYKEMKTVGLENTHEEHTFIPRWQRDVEEAYMITPRRRKVAIVGFGLSAPTPPEGITAPIIIITSFKFLIQHHNLVAGKIAVFDLNGRGKRLFESIGGTEAKRAGAVAALGRSIVSMSLYSVSARNYMHPESPIPIASIANEDVDLFVRLKARGENVTLFIKMNSTFANATSKNLMGEYMGKDRPDEVLVLGGHMDSWDVSQGAQDNGCGAYLALEVPQVLKNLSLVPKRTIRALLTVASEYNYLGSRQYISAHGPELPNHVGVLIADAGCGRPVGYVLSKKFPKLGCLLHELIRLFDPSFLPTNLSITSKDYTYTSSDVFTDQGLPIILMNGDAGEYFWIRHTYADTMSHMSSSALDDILVFWTTTAYVLADMLNKMADL